ncbi:MAG: hypothetical protein OXF96_05605 [Chloroflexi bacterium]|nr:hypothetical protein [Chloroflexota bacterium]
MRRPTPVGIPRRRVLMGMGIAVAGMATGACGEPAERADVNVFPTATEFVVGPNRFPFTVVTNDGVGIEQAAVDVRFSWLDGPATHFKFSRPATFYETRNTTPHIHADGSVHMHLDRRGYYVVAAAEFDTPGIWSAELTVDPPDADAFRARAAFNVTSQPSALGVGMSAPPIDHATLDDVADVEQLSSAEAPVPDMYAVTVAEALREGRPLVVQFSTPRFCVSHMCGPVYEEVASLHETYGDRVRFVHLEPFDLGIARAEGRLVPTSAFQAWSLQTEPWTFVIDRAGVVSARFEGMVGASELEAALQRVVGSAGTES